MLQSKFPTRFIKLVVGLFIYGIGVAMTVDAQLGLAPWDVLAQGISKQTTLTFGYATVAVSILVLIAWIPLRVKPGLGTVMNAVMVGLVADWAKRAILASGNNGEFFVANIGEQTPIGLARGLNAQWTQGGLLYAPPFR